MAVAVRSHLHYLSILGVDDALLCRDLVRELHDLRITAEIGILFIHTALGTDTDRQGSNGYGIYMAPGIEGLIWKKFDL